MEHSLCVIWFYYTPNLSPLLKVVCGEEFLWFKWNEICIDLFSWTGGLLQKNSALPGLGAWPTSCSRLWFRTAVGLLWYKASWCFACLICSLNAKRKCERFETLFHLPMTGAVTWATETCGGCFGVFLLLKHKSVYAALSPNSYSFPPSWVKPGHLSGLTRYCKTWPWPPSSWLPPCPLPHVREWLVNTAGPFSQRALPVLTTPSLPHPRHPQACKTVPMSPYPRGWQPLLTPYVPPCFITFI